MITELSILLPCYNNECHRLVADISAQAESVVRSGRRLEYEIIVADDGSTDKDVVAVNRRRIDALPCCSYVVRKENVGRAAIRNFLARNANYEWLLFIDSDMSVRGSSFLNNYLGLDNADVAYGGYTVANADAGQSERNLRYIYEKAYRRNRSAEDRRRRPYHDFHTSNFLIRRSIMLANPLDERFRRYGYEDVIFGKSLNRSGIGITHIDNPVSFEKFETNADFVAKTEEGLATLCDFGDELRGYSTLTGIADKLERLHLLKPFIKTFGIFAKAIKNNITGNKPSLLLFNIYKLGVFFELRGRKLSNSKKQS